MKIKMKKYAYYVDNIQVKRSEFFEKLKSQCTTVVDRQIINGWCGVDVVEFSEKKYKRCLKDINDNVEIFFIDGKYKQFKRRAV